VKKTVFSTLFIILNILAQAQQKGYTPAIEPCACPFTADSSLQTSCAYLIVPESRQKPAGKTIKLPFIYVKNSTGEKQ